MKDSKKAIQFNVPTFLSIASKDKKWTIIFVLIFMAIGIIMALGNPKTYTSSVELAPETTSNNMLSSISSIASMVGLYNDANPNGDAIYPEIYPDMMKSNDFLVGMFGIKLIFKNKNQTIHTDYYHYLRDFQKRSLMENLAGSFKKIFPQKEGKNSNNTLNPFRLTKEQDGIAQNISKRIQCTVDKKTNVISIQVDDKDPYIAAVIADSTKTHLQKAITKYRTQKAHNDLDYVERLFEESKADYVRARQKYATFSDANSEAVLQSVASIQEDLENEMQLKYNIYTQVSQQVQMAKAKLQESTPAFTVIQPASVPIRASSLGRSATVLLYVLFGFILRQTILILKHRREIFLN